MKNEPSRTVETQKKYSNKMADRTVKRLRFLHYSIAAGVSATVDDVELYMEGMVVVVVFVLT